MSANGAGAGGERRDRKIASRPEAARMFRGEALE
jgi:hypothetical protein